MNAFETAVKTILVSTLSLSSSLSFAALPTMTCVAKNAASEQLFLGEGLKWVGAKNAIEACEAFSEEHKLNASACKIVNCEAQEDDTIFE